MKDGRKKVEVMSRKSINNTNSRVVSPRHTITAIPTTWNRREAITPPSSSIYDHARQSSISSRSTNAMYSRIYRFISQSSDRVAASLDMGQELEERVTSINEYKWY